MSRYNNCGKVERLKAGNTYESRRSHGFSLLEMLIATALFLIISAGLAQLFFSQYNSFLTLKGRVNKEELVDMIRRRAGESRALRSSSLHPSNTAFRACVDNTHPGPASCATGTAVDFVLTDPVVGVAPNFLPMAGTEIVAGTTLAPVYYTREGAKCTLSVPSLKCPLKVTTTFTPTCLGGSPCVVAQSVRIDYRVEQDPAIVFPDGGTIKSSISSPTAADNRSIIVSVPFGGYQTAAPSTMAMWSTSEEVTGSVINQTADGEVLVAPVADIAGSCTVSNHGAIRNVNNGVSNGTLEICDTNAVPPGWRWFAGPPHNAAMKMAGKPNFPNLYVCPSGGNYVACDAAAAGPLCVGQVTWLQQCCMAGGMVACNPMY